MGIFPHKSHDYLYLFHGAEETEMTFETIVYILAAITGVIAFYLVFFKMNK